MPPADGHTLDTSGFVERPTGSLDVSAIYWKDLDAFTQGYIEALFAESCGLYWAGAKRGERMTRGFSDLAPETLDRIIADCAVVQPTFAHLPALRQCEGGRDFWANRRAGRLRRYHLQPFPPLTAYLGEDGRVSLTEQSNG